MSMYQKHFPRKFSTFDIEARFLTSVFHTNQLYCAAKIFHILHSSLISHQCVSHELVFKEQQISDQCVSHELVLLSYKHFPHSIQQLYFSPVCVSHKLVLLCNKKIQHSIQQLDFPPVTHSQREAYMDLVENGGSGGRQKVEEPQGM